MAPSAIPALIFDSTAYDSPVDAIQAWRIAIAPLFDAAPPSDEAPGAFRGYMHTYHLGTMLLANVESVAQRFFRSTSTIARSAVHHYLVQWFRRGDCKGDANGLPIDARQGDIVVLDLSQPVHSIMQQDFGYIALIVPRALLEPWLIHSKSVHGIVVRGETAHGKILGAHLGAVYERADHLSIDRAQLLLQATASMIAGCIGPAVSVLDAAAPNVRLASLVGIKRFVEANLASRELKPDLICQRFGLSRPTLFRMFEPHGGFSHYIRDRRLRRCFSEITSPLHAHRRISEIADNWCFNNEAVFSRAFRRLYQVSPREVRQAAQASPPMRVRTGSARQDRIADLDAWLHDLMG